MTYKILELRTNIDLKKSHPSFYTFDVLTLLNSEGEQKWLSVPYEMYFEWLFKNDEKITKYIAKREFSHHIDLINDLEEIGFKFQDSLLEYVNKYYPEKVFVMLPYYHPDGYNFT